VTLDRKREAEIVPSYSLTGDLLSFLRCGLQYRYHNGSSLPPSRPVQLWFGEFIHGVLEAAYRLWDSGNPRPAFPWPCTPTVFRAPPPANRVLHDIGAIGDIVESTLRAQGKISRSADTRASAYRRAEAAINEIAPHLFPLVAEAEERVIGTRQLTVGLAAAIPRLRARRYELHGIIDVLSDVTMQGAAPGNVIRDAIVATCPALPEHFEVIVDYKGTRRPGINDDFWQQTAWQVQTYGWLRTRQPGSLPVSAGVLLYINELAPGVEDLATLKDEIRAGATDVSPVVGSPDDYALSAWQRGLPVPQLSQQFRLRRAIRVEPITPQTQANATQRFDDVVVDIESCVNAEAAGGAIKAHWRAEGDEATCAACDFRHFCPHPYPRQAGQVRTIESPPAP